MAAFPFPREVELSSHFDDFNIEINDSARSLASRDLPAGNTPAYFPGEPTISCEIDAVCQYLCEQLLTPDLDRMHPYLWLVGTQNSTHISPLHEQIVKGRVITITERPELHCTWIFDRIFIKPIPACLLSWRFWQEIILSESSGVTESNRIALKQASIGFLRTYSYLIRSQSDFRLAKENHLIADDASYIAHRHFFVHFSGLHDSEVSLRYRFGELPSFPAE
ncbi:hypothetical protein F5Y16DRAFT_401721 [Xylariaceae sp. FL0255]|nr:hypothetical protein F5Y16DRAFT_401721 [Xylariaceae sp. FL0255]